MEWRKISSWWYRLERNGKRLMDVCNFDGRWTVPWSFEFFDTLEAVQEFALGMVRVRHV